MTSPTFTPAIRTSSPSVRPHGFGEVGAVGGAALDERQRVGTPGGEAEQGQDEEPDDGDGDRVAFPDGVILMPGTSVG